MDPEIEEDGPPPGWESIPKSEEEPINNDVDICGDDNDVDDEDQGPPPGWELNQYHHEVKQEADEEEEEESLDDGPPPGWETMAKSESNEMEEDDEDPLDDGPPPGWEPILHPSSPVQHQSPSIAAAITQPRSPKLEPVLKQEVKSEDDDDLASDGPPPGWESVDPHRGLSVATPSPPVVKQEGKGDDDIAPSSKWKSERIPFTKKHMAPPLPQSMSTPAAPSTDSEMGQMVCGSCRRLLSHPLGERYVQCSCCQTVNLVLEEHQVGQVQCRSCSVLLMYPYGASSVRCSCCRCVTNIGAHNRRPLLSVQQGRSEPPIPNPVH